MKRCIEWLMGFFAVLMLALVLNWSNLMSMAARHDLHEYANVVRQSSLSLEEKERLLDLTDKLQDHFQAGSKVGMLRWQEANNAIRLLLSDDIDEDDVRLIEEKLSRIERKSQMIAESQPLFDLGHVVSTPGALEALERANESPAEFLNRHVRGDRGIVDQEDQQANDAALQDECRILSAYLLSTGEKMWIITEADRSSTCLLLPEEY